MDYYDILGVEKTVLDIDIKKAYKNMALKNHPDKGGSEEDFKKITKAYEILSDSESRRRYDMGENVDNINNDIFKNFMQSFGMNFDSRVKKRNHFYEIKISLKECFFGFEKSYKINIDKNCFKCKKKCDVCGGMGIISYVQILGMMQIMNQSSCNKCMGLGIIKSDNRCEYCKDGKIRECENIILKVPRGLMVYEKLYESLGEQANNEDEYSGDLIIKVVVENNDDRFVRQNNNLIYKEKITFKESIIGKEIRIPYYESDICLNTKLFGIINPMIGYVINGKGMIKDGVKGDLIINFEINYPSCKLEDRYLEEIGDIFTKNGIE